jgi:hypothetical protein
MARRGSRLSRRASVLGADLAGLGLLAGCGRPPGQAQVQPARTRYGSALPIPHRSSVVGRPSPGLGVSSRASRCHRVSVRAIG